MAAELGHFALILAFCLALPQAFFGLAGAAYRRPHWMALTTRAVAGQFVFTAFAFACLAYAFLQERFLGAVRRAELEFRAADVLSLRGRVGRARRLAAAVAARAGDLDPRRRRFQPQHAGHDDESRARRARLDQRGIRALHSDDVESVRATVAGRAGRPRPESAAAGSGARDPSADALHRLRGLVGAVRVRRRRDARRQAGFVVGALGAAVDDVSRGCF